MTNLFHKAAQIQLARRDFWEYCKVRFPNFYTNENEYLKELCAMLQEFWEGDCRYFAMSMPPRHFKSCTLSMFQEWTIGNDKKVRTMLSSYNCGLAEEFSRKVRNSIEDDSITEQILFKDIFPDVKVKKGSSSVTFWGLDGNNEKTYLATSPTGTATGIGADIIALDDPIKSAEEAYNENILDALWDYIVNTLWSRREGKKKFLLNLTRWSLRDPIARLIDWCSKNNREIMVYCKKAFNGFDEDGKPIMLNPSVFSYDDYIEAQSALEESIFLANYQQEPIERLGLLYSDFQTYSRNDIKDIQFEKIISFCDWADVGTDYLCNIIAGVYQRKYYVLDIYYTKDAMEITRDELARRLVEFKVNYWEVESNSGGRGFGMMVGDKVIELKYDGLHIEEKTENSNKEARILKNQLKVLDMIIMPENLATLEPTFYKHIKYFKKEKMLTQRGKGLDAADGMSGLVDVESHINEFAFIDMSTGRVIRI